MLLRLVVAIALGALIGLERELIGKEAGVKTSLLVSAGSAIFTLIGISLPYLVAQDNLNDILARNGGYLNIIANIVVGIGFLGAGMILKNEHRVHGLTTAAVIWVAAGIGILAGLGLFGFAAAATFILSGLIFILRKASLVEKLSGVDK